MNRQPPGYEPDELPTAPPRVICGGEGWIRTSEGSASRFTVCPLWPAWVPLPLLYYNAYPPIAQLDLILQTGADDRTRTGNLLITNQLLCQLSYVGRPTAYFIIPTSPAEVKMGNFPEPYILSLLSRYLSSFLFTLCRALSTDLTCLFKSEAISW